MVRAASERAGLGSFGSHRLRHTAGTEMLRAGASLSEVAQVLRHRSIDTTVIYAKVDHLALRGLAMPWPGAAAMTAFCSAAADYLATRRAMGYKLAYQGQMLGHFVAYLEAAVAEHLTIAHALSWAKQPAEAAPVWWAARLGMVRSFARYLSALDPATEVPPVGLLPEPSHRVVPYIYSDDGPRPAPRGSRAALTATSSRHLSDPDRAVAVTGMRVGEAVRLDRDDFDVDQGLAHHPQYQVRQVSPVAAAPEHPGGPRRLRPPTR